MQDGVRELVEIEIQARLRLRAARKIAYERTPFYAGSCFCRTPEFLRRRSVGAMRRVGAQRAFVSCNDLFGSKASPAGATRAVEHVDRVVRSAGPEATARPAAEKARKH